ncbi:MAG: flagellar motor protein MotA, partial [Pseudomonadota bacterium]|nr:flagellar motor protein MotA [Pseudomonadota bacterium]
LTVGGFAELIGNLNFADETVLNSMQAGLSRPLAGMATAFTSSLLGLGGSLTIGFLSLQVQSAQNAIYHELEDY